ncbi:unnamed protein product [Paramecium pentaurelia]|uniref:Uncharacterized protein n=1 Tax=Paramecium pentaurelia TaxID=43138 RepID=A0A8S1SPS9_9CILI|nr:unnamed protein product [Paramecium pentaurelia]
MKAPSVVGTSKFSQYSSKLNRLGSRDISDIPTTQLQKQNQRNTLIYIELQFKIHTENSFKISMKISLFKQKDRNSKIQISIYSDQQKQEDTLSAIFIKNDVYFIIIIVLCHSQANQDKVKKIGVTSIHNLGELPKDFAEQILKNDITLMKSKYQDSMALNNLIKLYMKGVENYESQKDQKSEYFKTTRKRVNKKIDFNIHTKFDQIQHYEDVTSFEAFQEKPEKEISLHKAIMPIQNTEVKQMIDNLKMETTKIHQIIQNDLDSQKTKIADRIHKRSKSFVNKIKNDQDECKF